MLSPGSPEDKETGRQLASATARSMNGPYGMGIKMRGSLWPLPDQPQYQLDYLADKEEEHDSDQTDAPLLWGKGLRLKNLL